MAFFESAKKKAKVVVLALTLAATAAGAYAGSGKLFDVVTAKKTQRWEQRVALVKQHQTDTQNVLRQIESSSALLQKAEETRLAAEQAEKKGDFATALKQYERALRDRQTALSLLRNLDTGTAQKELQQLRKLTDPEDVSLLNDQDQLLKRLITGQADLIDIAEKTIALLTEKVNELRIKIAFKKK